MTSNKILNQNFDSGFYQTCIKKTEKFLSTLFFNFNTISIDIYYMSRSEKSFKPLIPIRVFCHRTYF